MTRLMEKGRRRRLPLLVAIVGVLALAVTLVVVLPAQAGEGLPTTTHGVQPTEVALGGEGNDCSAVGSAATYEYRVVSPATDTFTDPATGAMFTLTVTNGTIVDFTASGAAVLDVVIKGGTKSTHFDYAASVGAANSDTGLHAPTKGGSSNLYTASHTTFCYSTFGTISGQVFRDHNRNGAFDSAFEDPQAWTVTVYNAGGEVDSQTATGGDYEFANLPLGVQYTVCETPTGSDTWGQQAPVNGASSWTTGVCTSPREPDGHQLTLTGDAIADFANFRTVTLDCTGEEAPDNASVGGGSEPTGDVTISGEDCDKEITEFVFETWTDGGKQYASLRPVVTGTTGTAQFVERYQWLAPASGGDSQNATTLFYDDEVGAGLREMPYCQLDPRDGDFSLTPGTMPDQVLPPDHTSCLLSSTELAGDTREDWVYSSIDGQRQLG